MKLTKRQYEIIVGTVLGDGFLQKTGKLNSRLRLEHSAKQKEYIFWKVKNLGRVFEGAPIFLARTHPITKKIYNYFRIQSNSMPELGKIHTIFYPNGKKKIPKNLDEILSPLSLAVWYMDDGYYSNRDHSGYLYLGKTGEDEAKIAKEAIRKNFSLNPTILNKKNKGFVIYFSPREMKKFSAIIQKFVIAEMRYKIPS